MKEIKLSFPYPSTSRHNLSQDVGTSMGFSMLTPIRCVEVLPGDTHRIRTSFSLVSNPILKPLLQGVRLRYCRFWVPRRIYHLSQRANNSDYAAHELKYRYASMPLYSTIDQTSGNVADFSYSQYQASSMFDYFRLSIGNDFGYYSGSSFEPHMKLNLNTAPASSNNHLIFNAEPFIAYLDICRNYFADSATNTVAFTAYRGSVNKSATSLQFRPSTTLVSPLKLLDAYIENIQNTDAYAAVSAFNPFEGYNSSAVPSTGFRPFFLNDLDITTSIPAVTINTPAWRCYSIAHYGLCIPSNRPDRLSRLFDTRPLTSQQATIASSEINMSNLSFLSKIQRYLTRRFFGGSRFTDVHYSVFGQRVPHVDSPVLLDVFDYELGTELVASTNSTDDQNPGVLGGYFQAAGVLNSRHRNPTKRYRFNEGGYLIDLAYIMPRLFRETFTPDYWFVSAIQDKQMQPNPTQGVWIPDLNGIGWQQPAFTIQYARQLASSSASGNNAPFIPFGFSCEASWQQYRTLPDVSSGLLNSIAGIPALPDAANVNVDTTYLRISKNINSPLYVFGDHDMLNTGYLVNSSNPSIHYDQSDVYMLARHLYTPPVSYYGIFGYSSIDYDPFFVVFNFGHSAKRQVTKRFTLTL